MFKNFKNLIVFLTLWMLPVNIFEVLQSRIGDSYKAITNVCVRISYISSVRGFMGL